MKNFPSNLVNNLKIWYNRIMSKYTVGTPNADFDKNMLLLKNLQFSPNHYETLTQ